MNFGNHCTIPVNHSFFNRDPNFSSQALSSSNVSKTKPILSFVSLERFVRAFYFVDSGPLFSAFCWYQSQITAASDFKTS